MGVWIEELSTLTMAASMVPNVGSGNGESDQRKTEDQPVE
jgi:hypothetical protein